jgi:hypothetical protein
MTRLLPALLASLFAAGPLAAEPPKAVNPVIATLRADIRARPSRVLLAVEDALITNEQAACEIIQEAIRLTRADAKLTGDIVFTALRQAPGMSATIVECAMTAAPGALPEIKAALERALGEKAIAAAVPEKPEASAPSGKDTAGSGKETGKGAVAPPPAPAGPSEDFALYHVGIGGIYLILPARSILHPCDPDAPCCSGDLSTSCLIPQNP